MAPQEIISGTVAFIEETLLVIENVEMLRISTSEEALAEKVTYLRSGGQTPVKFDKHGVFL